MSQLESSHRAVFSISSQLTVLAKSIQNTLTILILMGLKYSLKLKVVFSEAPSCQCS